MKYDAALWEAQGGKCFFCADPMPRTREVGTNDPDDPSRDHLFPKAKYPLMAHVWVWCHRKCNQAKGHRDPELAEYCRYKNLVKDVQKLQSRMAREARKSV